GALAFGGEALSGDGCGSRSCAEEVACSEGGEDIASSCGAGGGLALEVSDDECAFGAVEGALQCVFPRAARAGVSFTQLGEARTTGGGGANGGIERISGEGVADADVSIEIREWGDEHRV